MQSTCQRAPQETADRLREADTKKGCRSSIRYVRAQSKEPRPSRSVPMNSCQPTGSTPQQLAHEHGMLRSARNLGGGCGSGVLESEPPKKGRRSSPTLRWFRSDSASAATTLGLCTVEIRRVGHRVGVLPWHSLGCDAESGGEREHTPEETGAPVSMRSERAREGTTAMVARTQLHKHFFHVVRRLGGRLEVRQLVLARIRLPLVSRDDSVLLPILLVRRECNDHVRLAVKFELAHPTFCTLERLEAVAQQNGQMLDESRVSKSDSDSDSSPSCEGCVRTLLYHTRRSRPRRRGSTLAPAPYNVPIRPCPRSQIGSCHRCRPMALETAGKQHPRL